MDFSLTTLFVLQDLDIAATGFARENLAPGQFGIFNSRYKAVATSASAANTPYVVIGQGRLENVPGLTHKYSDKIYKENFIEATVIEAKTEATVQISYAGYDETDATKTLKAGCDETYSLTVRLRSNLLDNAFAYGLTRTVTVMTPCCADCSDGCEKIEAAWLADAFAEKINEEPELSKYVTATVVTHCEGEGEDEVCVAGVKITGKALDKYGNPCDPIAFPHEYDKLTFEVFAYKGAATSQDSTDVYDRCDNIPVTLGQRSGYVIGTAEEMFELEKRYHSYQTTMKHIFHNPAYNGAFVRYTTPGQFYNQIVMKFKSPAPRGFEGTSQVDESVILVYPTPAAGDTEAEGKATALITLLKEYFGASKFNS